MINMAVISLKDIIKYLFKITICVTLVIFVTKYFSNQNNVSNRISNIDNYAIMTTCIQTTIPATTIMATENENKDITAKALELAVLDSELELFTSVIQNETEEIEENINDSENTEINNEEAIVEVEPKVEDAQKEEKEEVKKAETGIKTEVQSSNVPNKYTTKYNEVKIKNETDYKLTEEILTPNIEVNKDNILIFHTHSCESYTASEKYQYKQTGNFRTTNKNYSVIRVGNELETQLKSYGYNVIHDETIHDYPSYSGSYSNSLKTVTSLLGKNKNTDVVIDIHRDAIGDNTYAPTVKIGDEYAAQLMFVIGGNGSSIKHENWQQNLKFAVKVQEKANELYPGLFKPIILRYSGYNQHVAKAASIIEVGATGNTLDQTLVSMKYLAKVLSEVVK